MTITRPIKRSIELQPLSREHHDGLLFVWKIRQGLKNGTSTEKLNDFVSWYWKNHIRPHFYQEEKILIPFALQSELSIRIKTEHENIREIIIDIDKDPVRGDLVRLSDLIEKHIRFEERIFFPYLESLLSPADLAEIRQQLERHPLEAHCLQPLHNEWKEEFWLKN
jgi:hemerythrin-like domain-containing protein